MIRLRERSPWLALSVFLSDNAAAITNSARYLGGTSFARTAKSVLDEVRQRDQPTQHLLRTIDQLFLKLLALSEQESNSVEWCSELLQVEDEFTLGADISLLLNEFEAALMRFKAEQIALSNPPKRGAA